MRERKPNAPTTCDIGGPTCEGECPIRGVSKVLRKAYVEFGWHYWNQYDVCARCWEWTGSQKGKRRAQVTAELFASREKGS